MKNDYSAHKLSTPNLYYINSRLTDYQLTNWLSTLNSKL